MPSSPPTLEQPCPSTSFKTRVASHWVNAVRVVRRHVYFLGPGIVASVAYADPGNWATDLQAGSEFGYSLLFIVLMTGSFAVFIQILSCRVGVVTNTDLARQCRMLILKEDRHGSPTQCTISHPKWRRWGLLYPLYLIAEGAIIATELAELTGSAIALNLLFPALPLWAGILVTSVDVILILFIYKPPPNGSFRLLEALIAILVFIVLACFIVLLVRIKPYWPDVFHGYLPSRKVVQSGALYVSVGILGATVMPHAIILGSHFASIDRLPSIETALRSTSSPANTINNDRQEIQPDQTRWEIFSGSFRRILRPKPETKAEVIRLSRILHTLISSRSAAHHVDDSESVHFSHRHATFVPDDLPPRTLENIRIHIKHASVDIGMSLVSFAIVINSAILIVAAAAFYYADSNAGSGQVVVASLYDAFYLLKERLGSLAAILFAVALLAAGQSASITVTLAGQLVSEGFINWRTDPFLRRVFTRLVAVVPSLAVSLAVGKDGLDEMLVASQVALSIALPFVLLPLILVTGSKVRMTAVELGDEIDVASAESSARSSVQAQRQSGEQLEAVKSNDNEDASKNTVTHRPGYPREASSNASLSIIEMLPHQQDSSLVEEQSQKPVASNSQPDAPSSGPLQVTATKSEGGAAMQSSTDKKSQCFASAWYVQAIAYAIFAVIVVADGYVLITTFMGE
ncbi:related to vacuolar transport protein ESP1 [Melanopsichium pennsylvanicum]|uniref:Related to vacuolar transport protein ESP1 n=2 Tax=Melanopsichium pennsylvanicum TaxID=63383 RepID=A0AAJ4XT29_9BASI|nr:related to vacuolar transport protein ESP1 [Melanopsichium pennsylvanicum 4]SNX87506.1 related to vacuolar transport protein ESP1 [Melanopsichium pennsylvanicum]